MGELTEAQVLALADIADGVSEFIQPNTAASLRSLGLANTSGLTKAGRLALERYRREWPALLAAHNRSAL